MTWTYNRKVGPWNLLLATILLITTFAFPHSRTQQIVFTCIALFNYALGWRALRGRW